MTTKVNVTPELLEKNGFHWGNTAGEEESAGAVGAALPEKGWCFDEGAGEIKIIFPVGVDSGLLRIDDQSFDRHLELFFSKSLELNELRHAIRLCKIEKEIIL